MNRRLPLICFLSFLGFTVLIITLANAGHLGRYLPSIQQLPWFDKAGHFVLMGLLGFFLNLTLIAYRPDHPKRAALYGLGILTLFMALEESSQFFISSRNFSIADFLFGLAGALLATPAALFAFLLQKKDPAARMLQGRK